VNFSGTLPAECYNKLHKTFYLFSYAGITRFRFLGMISAQQNVEHPLVKVGAKVRIIFEKE
jgi:hypothetical protein